jgi:hypothetical protein
MNATDNCAVRLKLAKIEDRRERAEREARAAKR